MTTIVDPTGTPSITYNRSGTTIVSVTAAGTNQAGAAVIPRVSAVTVALVTSPNGSNYCVTLPSGAEVGDVVEVYCDGAGGSNVQVFPDSSSAIWPATPPSLSWVLLTNGRGVIARMVSSNQWAWTMSA